MTRARLTPPIPLGDQEKWAWHAILAAVPDHVEILPIDSTALFMAANCLSRWWRGVRDPESAQVLKECLDAFLLPPEAQERLSGMGRNLIRKERIQNDDD
jgi:hypothetical protein